jgi:hypothetical protein
MTAVVAAFALPAHAALEADPAVLYQQMKAAYDKASAAQWDFVDQEVYLSTIFNAGRAYSLQRPADPAFAELETLTVQIGSGLHYNPLTNHDAAVWYVREAAVWVSRNSSDPALVADGKALLDRVNSEDDPQSLARLADEDAQANAATYPADVDTRLQTVEANWRAWLLTGDRSWRSLAFQKAAATNFPLAHLPTTYGPGVCARGGTCASRHDRRFHARRSHQCRDYRAAPQESYLAADHCQRDGDAAR